VTDPLLRFRERFPILDRTTYLVSNSLGAMPVGARERLAAYADTWETRGVRAWADEWWEMPLTVGDGIAPLIGASQGEVAMVPNVTLGQAAVISALDYESSRDTIVMTELDFPSVRYVYEGLASRLGARIDVVESEDGISIDTQRVIEAIDDRTRLVAISHVLFRSAYVMDVESICARAREVGALVSLDAFHSVGVMPVDVKRIGADFLTGGVLKWLCGGPGGCFLYASPEVSRSHAPALTGWQAHGRPFAFEGEMEYAAGAARWLSGTPVIPALYAATEGPRIIREVGIDAVREKSLRQTELLIDLADEQGWTLRAPREGARRGGTVALDVPQALEISRLLLSREILVDFRPGAGIRIAPHFYTMDDEIRHAVASIVDALATGEWRNFQSASGTVT
jgi:kynureninase